MLGLLVLAVVAVLGLLVLAAVMLLGLLVLVAVVLTVVVLTVDVLTVVVLATPPLGRPLEDAAVFGSRAVFADVRAVFGSRPVGRAVFADVRAVFAAYIRLRVDTSLSSPASQILFGQVQLCEWLL